MRSPITSRSARRAASASSSSGRRRPRRARGGCRTSAMRSSPATGGSLENRMRFLVETLAAMRAAIGPDLPLGVRLKLDDMEQRGMAAEEYQEVVRCLEARGLVDYVSVTGGDGPLHHGPMPRPEGEWLPLVQQLRAATTLPLMHAGRIATPEMAERALAEGLLDLVCMTKTHICDP